jgi:hypothetical protein
MSIRQAAKNILREMVSKTRGLFMLYHLTILSIILCLSGGCGSKKSMGDLIGYLKAEGWEGTYNAKLAQIIGAEEGGSYEGTSFAVEIYCFSSAAKAESAQKAGLSNETCYQNGTFILVADETEKKLIHSFLNFNKTIKKDFSEAKKASPLQVSENNQKECRYNLLQIEGAVEQCRLAGIKAPKASDIFGPNNYIKTVLVCPTAKLPYVLTNTDNPDWKPTCPCGDTAALLSANNQNRCQGNLMQIQAAVEQCRLAGIKAPKASDIFGSKNYIIEEPVCPTVKLPYVMTNTDNTDWAPVCPGGIEGHVVK